DYFRGPVPVTDRMTDEEVESAYEENPGHVIARVFENIDPIEVPAVLVANHAPFTWGITVSEAAQNAIILEAVAKLAHLSIQIRNEAEPAGRTLHDKHFLRKHGSSAYYGQPKAKAIGSSIMGERAYGSCSRRGFWHAKRPRLDGGQRSRSSHFRNCRISAPSPPRRSRVRHTVALRSHECVGRSHASRGAEGRH